MALVWHRVRAIIYKNFLSEKRNAMRLTEAMYFPVWDIMIWGFASVWMSQTTTNIPSVVTVVLTGLVFWQMVLRASFEISIPLVEELWHHSFVALFATPISLAEWIVGNMITGMLKTLFVLGFGGLVVWLLHTINIFGAGWMLLPFVLPIIWFGWAIGFVGASIIVYGGQKVSNMPWVIGWMFVPFSAIFYSVDVLPYWAQLITKSLPMVYIFEGMRKVIFTGQLHMSYLITSYSLSLFYLVLGLGLFCIMFEKSRKKGLDRL